jgi:hypothetical protein
MEQSPQLDRFADSGEKKNQVPTRRERGQAIQNTTTKHNRRHGKIPAILSSTSTASRPSGNASDRIDEIIQSTRSFTLPQTNGITNDIRQHTSQQPKLYSPPEYGGHSVRITVRNRSFSPAPTHKLKSKRRQTCNPVAPR